MRKINHLKKGIIFLLFLCCGYPWGVSAHEGHDHSHDAPVCINKSTFVHLQSILSAYKDIYSHLVKKDSNGITDLAQKMMDSASQGIKTESDGAGYRMMQHILQGAEELKNAEDLHEVQHAFTSISNALFHFFKSWPNQLKRNEIKLYWCKKDGYYWLQPQNLPPVCPYAMTGTCSDLEELKN